MKCRNCGVEVEDQHLSRSDAAKYLGISLRWFEELRKSNNAIPSFRLGKRWLFRKSELDNWIETFRDKRN